MITLKCAQVGSREPILSIILAVDAAMESDVERLIRYLIEIDHPGIEVVLGVVSDEPFREMEAKNEAARCATTDYLAFTNAGVYPSASMIEKTRRELELNPNAIIEALRLDGLPDYGVFPNPFAMGDWQCMTRGTFDKIGGYNEKLNQAGGIENDLLSRATVAGSPIVLLDERVYHSYHAPRFVDESYQRLAAENAEITRANGPEVVLRYPDVCSPQMQKQSDSVLEAAGRPLHNPDYWDFIFEEKAMRQVEAGFKVVTHHPVATDSPDMICPDAATRENNSNPKFYAEMVGKLNCGNLLVLDLGCAGGQFVADGVSLGYSVVGLEGCSLPSERKYPNWSQLDGTHLFTCDISKPFVVTQNTIPAKFDIVTAWDVIEHIAERDLPVIMTNIRDHLKPGGLLICTIASDSSATGGLEHHQTIKSQEWWVQYISRYLKPVDITIENHVRRSCMGVYTTGELVFAKQ